MKRRAFLQTTFAAIGAAIGVKKRLIPALPIRMVDPVTGVSIRPVMGIRRCRDITFDFKCHDLLSPELEQLSEQVERLREQIKMMPAPSQAHGVRILNA